MIQNDSNVTTTPRRRRDSPSRLMSAFSQLYLTPNSDTQNSSPRDTISTIWNNVKYGWSGKIKTNFSTEQPVWLLGRCYHRKSSPDTSQLQLIEPSSTKGKFVVIVFPSLKNCRKFQKIFERVDLDLITYSTASRLSFSSSFSFSFDINPYWE